MTPDVPALLVEWEGLAGAQHVYLGLCPEGPDRLDQRDPDCPACRREDALPAATAALQAVLDLVRFVGNESTGPEYVACYEVRDAITAALTKEA